MPAAYWQCPCLAARAHGRIASRGDRLRLPQPAPAGRCGLVDHHTDVVSAIVGTVQHSAADIEAATSPAPVRTRLTTSVTLLGPTPVGCVGERSISRMSWWRLMRARWCRGCARCAVPRPVGFAEVRGPVAWHAIRADSGWKPNGPCAVGARTRHGCRGATGSPPRSTRRVPRLAGSPPRSAWTHAGGASRPDWCVHLGLNPQIDGPSALT